MVNMAAPAFTGAVSVTGVSDARQLTVRAYGSQTAPVMALQDGAGNNKMWVDAAFNLILNGSASVASNASTDTLSIATGAASNLLFKRGGTESGRFGSDGSFLVGTATNGGWSNAAKLEAVAGSGAQAISAYNNGSSDGAAFLGRVDNAANLLCSFICAGTFVGGIATNGSATAYNTTSDARLKTVLEEQRNYRAAIQALWVGDFSWKASGEKAFGVLAQQAWENMPWHAGVTPPANEADEWYASAEPFAHLALWGVKDLYALVEALTARIKVLEGARDAG
jgi:hypothetical protein